MRFFDRAPIVLVAGIFGVDLIGLVSINPLPMEWQLAGAVVGMSFGWWITRRES